MCEQCVVISPKTLDLGGQKDVILFHRTRSW